MKARVLLFLLGGSLVPARAAFAAAPSASVELAWDAPDACPARTHVLLEVERLLDRELVPSEQPALRVAASVRAVPRGFVLEVVTTRDGDTRQREVRDDACGPLADAAALIIALTIDPGAGGRALAKVTPAVSEPAAVSTPSISAPTRTRDARSPAPTRGIRVRALLGTAAAVDTSALPSAGAGFTAWAGVALDAWSLEGRGSYFPSRRAEVGPNLAQGGDVSLAAGGIRLCYAGWRPAGLTLGPCAGFELGLAMATGFGVDSPSSGEALWAAPSLGVRATYALVGPVDAVATLEGLVPVVRDRFVLDPTIGEVHRLPAATARLELGLRVAIP